MKNKSPVTEGYIIGLEYAIALTEIAIDNRHNLAWLREALKERIKTEKEEYNDN